MAFYRLEQLINLYDGYQRAFSVGGHSLLLIQDQGQRYLLLNQCPHQHAPLDRGAIQNGQIRCPQHGMQFDLSTGSTSGACSAKLQFLTPAYDGNMLGVYL
jgi:nitrite reductase/ring-hydroxylating ferredoxin subunit